MFRTSAYTARACTRPNDFWDGIKRDRLGWYGDARITAMTWAAAFFDPRPAAAMLGRLSTSQWVNGIPSFSFDAIAMFRDMLMVFGLDVPGRVENWAVIVGLLDWVDRTQTGEDGFVVKTDGDLFFGLGFHDWSPMPVGGRLEDLAWQQCKYMEAMRSAGQVAHWLDQSRLRDEYAARAGTLEQRIVARFWEDGVGFHHTQRAIRPGFETYGPGWADASYDSSLSARPSSPSRHSTACAVFASLDTPDRRPTMLHGGFDATGQPPVITPMFLYYEMEARARLGDPTGAVATMTRYLREMVLPHDSATIWESFEPKVRDFRKWGLHGWPKSLCHGWGSGLVPLAQRWLLGLEFMAPGCGRARIHRSNLSRMVTASVPTPHGLLRVEGGEVSAPAGIELEFV